MSEPLYPGPTTRLPEIEDAIRVSVEAFREQWGMMASYAISMGYIEKYRQELQRIADLAYAAGIDKATPHTRSANAQQLQSVETPEKNEE